MTESILRDGYIVIVKDGTTENAVYANDTIEIEDGYCFKDGKKLGYISNIIEDVYEVAATLEQLRKSGTLDSVSMTPIILNPADVERYNICEGTVSFNYKEFIVAFVGIIAVQDEEELKNIDDMYDELCDAEEDVYYTLTEKGLELLESIAKEEACECEREEKKTMDNLFGNLGFGKIKGSRFKLSMNGIAVAQNNGKYVVFNKDSNEFVDVTNMLFDIKDALFLLPAVEVSVGDTVLHEGKPYFIVDTTNEIKAVDYETCTQTVLIPKSTMFGIKYFQKVFSMFGDNFASAGDLFSNPMMLMALMDGSNKDLTQMMLFSSMTNGDLGSNPMALAMMLKGDKDNDSLSTIAMLSMFNGGTNPFAPKKKETKKVNADK